MSKILSAISLEPVAILAVVIAALQAVSDQLNGGVSLKTAIVAGVVILLSGLVRLIVTPISAPTLDSGTEVSVTGSADKVIVQPTPPGPTGVDASGGLTDADAAADLAGTPRPDHPTQ